MFREEKFGKQKDSYGVSEQPNGRIQIRVYHNNKGIRDLIYANCANPQYFLRYSEFDGDDPRAKYYLAIVVKHYRRYFEKGMVEFVFV